MKQFACVTCGHVWFESQDAKQKTGWGCPNGCYLGTKEIDRNHFSLIDELIDEYIKHQTVEEKKVTFDKISKLIDMKKSMHL